MGGFGTIFGTGPYGGTTPPEPVEPVTTAVSCRLIDGVTRDYVTDADGNPEADDGTANRVYLLLSYADSGAPEIISAAGLQARKSKIADALVSLTTGPTPAIRDLVVDFVDNGGSGVDGTVSYFDLATQQPVTLVVD